MQSKNKQNVNIADESLTDYSFLSRSHYTKSKNQKDDIEFVTEFPCLLGHPAEAQLGLLLGGAIYYFVRVCEGG